LMAPAHAPQEVVRRLHASTVAALARPEVKERFGAIGTDVAPLDPAQLGRFIEAEIAHWAKLVKLAGIQPEEREALPPRSRAPPRRRPARPQSPPTHAPARKPRAARRSVPPRTPTSWRR